MLRNSDDETEILLGNKQLLGIFFVMAVLLGVAFTGGYMVGRSSPSKKSAASSTASPAETASSSTSNPASGGETHSIPPEVSDSGSTGDQSATGSANTTGAPSNPSSAQEQQEPPLGSRARKSFEEAHPPAAESNSATPVNGFAPQAGQEFLQVAAVGRDEAEAVADVLHKKGFAAHAVPKPGNPKIYRVLIGPVRDTADLSTTRDSLRKTGFREVIVQKY